MTKFYTFMQNNSGGSFDHDETAGIGYAVIVEAKSEDSAINTAENIGLYFDGSGDCPCCGPRWSSYADGAEVPSIYGTPVEEDAKINPERSYNTWWGLPVYVHYLDGRVVRHEHELTKPKENQKGKGLK